jgi:hypothetical protein
MEFLPFDTAETVSRKGDFSPFVAELGNKNIGVSSREKHKN